MIALRPDDVAHSCPRLASSVERHVDESGHTRLRGPLLRRGPISRIFARAFKLPQRVEVEIDAIGEMYLDLLDGRTLAGVASAMADRLQLGQREAEAAVTVYTQALLKRRLLVLDGLVEGRQ